MIHPLTLFYHACRYHFKTANEGFSVVLLTNEDLNRNSSRFRPYFHLSPRCHIDKEHSSAFSNSEHGEGVAAAAAGGGVAANKKARVRVSKEVVVGGGNGDAGGDDDEIIENKEEILSQVGRLTKDRARKLVDCDKPTEARNSAESVLVMAFHKMVEKVTLTVGEMVAQMGRQQVHELMLEAWDGLDHPSRAEYLAEAVTTVIDRNKKKNKASKKQQQQRKQSATAGGDRSSTTVSVTGQKRKAAAAALADSSSSGPANGRDNDDDDNEFDHDSSGRGTGRRTLPSITTSMSPQQQQQQQQQTFLRSPSSSSSSSSFSNIRTTADSQRGQSSRNIQQGGSSNSDPYKPPRVREILTTLPYPFLSQATHTSTQSEHIY